MQMLVIVLLKAAFLKLGAIDPFQCSHKELQEEMEGEGQQGIYIYNFFSPQVILLLHVLSGWLLFETPHGIPVAI